MTMFLLLATTNNVTGNVKSSGPAPAPLPSLIPKPKPVPIGYSCSAHNLYNTEITVNDIMENLITSTSYALASTKAAPLTLAKRDTTGSTELYTVGITNAIDFLPAPESLTPVIITINGNIPVMHTTGQYNFFAGPYTGNWNTTSEYNTGLGYQNLPNVTSGSENTAIGYGSLATLTTGTANTAVGAYALAQTTDSQNNTALGYNSLGSVITGNNNTGIGNYALASATTSNNNTGVGNYTLANITTGSNNVALGDSAGANLTDGNNNIYLAHPGTPHDTGTMRLGNTTTQTSCFIAGIKDVPLKSGNFLAIDTNDQLGTFSHADVRAALVDDKNNLCLGTLAAASDSKTLRLGNTTTQTSCFIAGIKDVPLKSGNFLAIDTNGQLGTFSHADVQNALIDAQANSCIGVAPASATLVNPTYNLCFGTLAAQSDNKTLRLGNTTTQTSCFIAGIKDVPLKSGNFLAIDTNGQLGTFSHADVQNALIDAQANSCIGVAPASATLVNPTYNLCFGTLAAQSDNKTLRLGNTTTQTSCFIAGIKDVPLKSGNFLAINTNGQLGTFSHADVQNALIDAQANSCIGVAPTGATLVNPTYNLCFGTQAAQSDNKTLRLGNTTTQTSCFIAGIATTPLPSGSFVGVMSNGQLGIMPANILDAELVDEQFNICIGRPVPQAESNVIRLGTTITQTSCFIAGIYNTSMANGNTVIVNSDGQLGVLKSSERYKHEITDLSDSTALVHKLRPVSFKFNWNIDPQQIIQYGLIAEEVAKIDPNLVLYDDSNQPLAVKYHLITAILIKALQEQQTAHNELTQALLTEHKRTDALEQAVHQLLAKTSHHTN